MPTPRMKPGQALRFGVEAPDGRRSTEFRIWTSKRTDDTYVAGREAGGWIKVSLHQSGEWLHGFTKDAFEEGFENPAGGRHFERWHRPPERALGITLAMRILIPTSELRPGPSSVHPSKKPVYLAPPPQQGNAVAFDVYLIAPDHEVVQFDRSLPVGCLDLPSGSVVWVVAREVDLDGDPADMFAEQVQEARQDLCDAGVILPEGMTSRIVVHGHHDGINTIQFVELAVDM